LTTAEGKTAFSTGTAVYELPATANPALSATGQGLGSVVLGIRPEDVCLSLTPEPDHEPGEIFVTEPLGPDVLVTVKVQDTMVKARVPAPFRVSKDSRVYVRLTPNKIHLFGEEDGAAVLAPTPV
jgi:multiple sugar transport system ATP-binding protein